MAMDNSKGYIKGNMVPCCWECNHLKGTRSHDEFVERVRKIAVHLENTEK